MTAGVLGGTFDPPHVGHLVLAEQAREQLRLERVFWVPAGDPWRKSGREVTPAQERLEMVRLAVEGYPAFEVLAMEAERERPSYSVDTMAELRGREPGTQWYFICGADALEDLPNWHDPERLIALATLAVAARSSDPPSVGELDRLLPGLGARVVWLAMPRLEMSATDLRRRAAYGRSLRYLVPEAVRMYITERRLYSKG